MQWKLLLVTCPANFKAFKKRWSCGLCHSLIINLKTATTFDRVSLYFVIKLLTFTILVNWRAGSSLLRLHLQFAHNPFPFSPTSCCIHHLHHIPCQSNLRCFVTTLFFCFPLQIIKYPQTTFYGVVVKSLNSFIFRKPIYNFLSIKTFPNCAAEG